VVAGVLTVKILADASDEAAWLWKRRGYVSASEMFKLLTHDELVTMGWWRESWMDEPSEELFQRKLDGTSPEFGNPVAVEWGKFEEDHNRQLFTDYAGLMTAGCHSFLGSDRWPFLATTLDGFVYVGDEWEGLARPEMFVDPEATEAAIRALPRNTRCLLEMKQAGEYSFKCWLNGYSREPMGRDRKTKVILGKFVKHPPTMPVYYLSQVQTQMAIAGFDHNLAVCKGGASNLVAHAYTLSPDWLDILDALNERVADRMTQIRKALNDAK
jgi:hypothetical protein